MSMRKFLSCWHKACMCSFVRVGQEAVSALRQWRRRRLTSHDARSGSVPGATLLAQNFSDCCALVSSQRWTMDPKQGGWFYYCLSTARVRDYFEPHSSFQLYLTTYHSFLGGVKSMSIMVLWSGSFCEPSQYFCDQWICQIKQMLQPVEVGVWNCHRLSKL
jgi:hypothetical protein